jgi:hypothetical protein
MWDAETITHGESGPREGLAPGSHTTLRTALTSSMRSGFALKKASIWFLFHRQQRRDHHRQHLDARCKPGFYIMRTVSVDAVFAAEG